MVWVCFFRPERPNWFQRLIRWRTLGEYSHVAVAFSTDSGWFEVWEAREGGIRMSMYKALPGEPVPFTCTKEQRDLIRRWWERHDGAPYDAVGLIELATGKRSSRKEAWFCSEAATASLQQTGAFLFADPSIVSPVTLWYMVKAREEAIRE